MPSKQPANLTLRGDASSVEVLCCEARDFRNKAPFGSIPQGRAALTGRSARVAAMGFVGSPVALNRLLIETAERG